jgi:hypothetical protein
MQTFNFKSLLMGVGIGMIITSIISMLYISAMNLQNGQYENILENSELSELDGGIILENNESTMEKEISIESIDNTLNGN